jgi:hypothetical protein
MANEIYHRTNWGEAKPEDFGDMYFDPSATNKLYNRSTYYENSDATDKILGDIPNKASIVLTPTGYSEDSINTAIPPYQVLSEELVTNGTFDTDLSGWTLTSDATATWVNGRAFITTTQNYKGLFQDISGLNVGSKYLMKYSTELDTAVEVRMYVNPPSTNLIKNLSGDFELTFIATNTNVRVDIQVANSTGSAYFDNVSLKEIQEADFTFARNSSATRVNQAGLIEDVNSGTNLVTNGTFDTDSDWTLGSNISISDGKLVFNNATSNTDFAQQGIVAPTGKNYKITFTVSDLNSGDSITIRFPFVDTSVNTNGTHTIFGVGIEANFIRITPYSSTGTFSIDDLSVIQLDEATDIPRLDYTTGQGAFLLEPQRTNKLGYSEDFSNDYWIKTNINTSSSNFNVTTSPDGSMNADKLVADTTSGQHKIDRTETVTNGATVALSVFVKKAEYEFCCLFEVQSSKGKFFDLSNGTIGGDFVGTPTTSKIESFGNDWFRVSITTTVPSTSARWILYVCETISNTSLIGDNSKGIFVWGTQLEEGAFETSYIPATSTAGVTRSAETANSSGNSTLINSTEGVLYAEIAALADDQTSRAITLSDGTTNNEIRLYFNAGSSNQIVAFLNLSGTYQCVLVYTSLDITQFSKIAFKYKQNDFSLYVDGVERATDTSGNTFSSNTLNKLSFAGATDLNDFYGKAKGVAVFKEALTDIELEKLTSWRDFRDLAESQQYTLVTIKSDAIVVSAYGTTSGGGGVSGGGSGGGGGY